MLEQVQAQERYLFLLLVDDLGEQALKSENPVEKAPASDIR